MPQDQPPSNVPAAGPSEAEPSTTNPPEQPALPLPPEALDALRETGVDPADPKVAKVVEFVASISRSPFPSPEMLAAYEAFRPGFAEIVIQHLQDQTRHRQSLELITTKASERRQDRAQHYAAGLAVVGLIIAGVIALGHGTGYVAAVIATVAVGGPAAATVIARFIR